MPDAVHRDAGRHAIVGLVIFAIFAAAFGAIAADVLAHGRLARFDVQISSWFEYRQTPGLTQAARLVTALGGWRVATGVSVLVGAYWARRRAWRWLTALVLAVPIGQLIDTVVKDAFHRARPHWEHPLLAATDFGFPSGHAMAAATLYGLLGLWLATRRASWRWRAAVVGLALPLILLVALSRVVLGAHYPSDVLAGICAGLAWLDACLMFVGAGRQREAG